jgi:lipoprotein Spr
VKKLNISCVLLVLLRVRNFIKIYLLFGILNPSIVFSQNTSTTINKDSLITFCKSFLGTKYCYSSCNPKKGFDCSGFVYYVYSHFNITVPRSSIEYKKYGKRISVDSSKVGDIIVFTGTNSKNRNPGHVGIVISEQGNDLQFIHSSSGKRNPGIIISSFKESPYYKNRFLKIVRISQ